MEWCSATQFFRDIKALEKLNKRISRVCAAIIELNCYDFKILMPENILESEKKAKIIGLPFDSPYHFILVYEDGIVQYFNMGGNLRFEGNTKSISTIKMDILQIG